MEEYKKKVMKMSDYGIICEHKRIMSELYDNEEVDAEKYEDYWKNKRPILEKKMKMVENELSYRCITT